ncbi:MAG TPA: DUF3313 domain-containing protein [Verrucomicrobiae bacterium]|nr:DUF3313 domain-containing protein [Verrucomicrobiae bacterium]
MNISTTANQAGGRRRWKWPVAILAAALLVGGLTACRTAPRVQIGEKDFSGFLGDYSRLRQGEKGEANFLYIDRDAGWGNYTKICIRPVELWKSDGPESALGNLSPQNQQMLVNFFHTALVAKLGKNYQIVNYAGPDVLVVHAAVTDARNSRPVVNLVSKTVSANLLLNFEQQTITGTGTGVGMVMVEVELLDGQNGQRLAAAVDARPGTKALRIQSGSTWGEVMLAFDWWAQKLDQRLAKLRAGIVTKDPL